MTSEQKDELLQSADLLRQTVTAVYRDARGAEEYALSVVLLKIAECENVIVRCAA